MQPTVFVSHGAPTLAVEPTPAHRFLRGLGGTLSPPRAVLIVSAHWMREFPTVTGAAQMETIHDFRGFPEALYQIRYPAVGDPALAADIVGRLNEAGLQARLDDARGLDHGAWVPASLVWPEPGCPVLQLSLVAGADARAHYALGRALAPLREDGVLVLGSGGATHNLAAFRGQSVDTAPAPWAVEFADWLTHGLEAGDHDRLLDWETIAPQAYRNHPTPEHLLPLFVAAGAAVPDAMASVLHRSFEFGVLAMDAWRFD